MAGTVVLTGILVYTDLAAQVKEQGSLGESTLAPLPVPSDVVPSSYPDPTFSIFPPDTSTHTCKQTLGTESWHHPEGLQSGNEVACWRDFTVTSESPWVSLKLYGKQPFQVSHTQFFSLQW